MHDRPAPDYAALILLFERARRDPAARAELGEHFDAWAVAMRDGREARRELGMLAYLVAEKQAERDLRPNGRFGDLRNDPGSVASRHWQRFQNFCDEIDGGARKSVDDFMARVNCLTKYVLLDMVTEKQERERDGGPIDGDISDPGGVALAVDPARPRDDYHDALRRARQALPCRLFLVVVLHLVCTRPLTEIAEILGTTPYYVKLDLEQARRLLDRAGEGSADGGEGGGWDLPTG